MWLHCWLSVKKVCSFSVNFNLLEILDKIYRFSAKLHNRGIIASQSFGIGSHSNELALVCSNTKCKSPLKIWSFINFVKVSNSKNIIKKINLLCAGSLLTNTSSSHAQYSNPYKFNYFIERNDALLVILSPIMGLFYFIQCMSTDFTGKSHFFSKINRIHTKVD